MKKKAEIANRAFVRFKMNSLVGSRQHTVLTLFQGARLGSSTRLQTIPNTYEATLHGQGSVPQHPMLFVSPPVKLQSACIVTYLEFLQNRTMHARGPGRTCRRSSLIVAWGVGMSVRPRPPALA